MRIGNDLRDRVLGMLTSSILSFLIVAIGLSLLSAMLVVGAGVCMSQTNSVKYELVRFIGG